jgi:predicted peptidase
MLVLLTCVSAAHARPQETGFLDRSVTVDGVAYRYQVYVPANYTPEKEWPVVLFLHGAGERGDDGLLQTQVGLGAAIRRHADRFPGIVVFPQARPSEVWSGEMERQALRALDQTMREFRADPRRVYLTGLSMGGYGTWSIAARHPGRFAALVVVCGGIRRPNGSSLPLDAPGAASSADPYAEYAKRIGSTPVWVFHGAADPVVPVTESRSMVEALRSAGGNVRYTEYEGVGHNSWDPAYAEPELASWLFAQRLGG